MRALPRIVAATPIGNMADVEIWRDGAQLRLAAKIGKLPEEEVEVAAAATEGSPEAAEVPVDGREELLGISIAPLTEELRSKYRIGNDIDGVVITKVDPKSEAAQKRVKAGDVIVEVTQEKVTDPQEVLARVDEVKRSGTKSVLLLISDAKGGLRFVAVPVV